MCRDVEIKVILINFHLVRSSTHLLLIKWFLVMSLLSQTKTFFPVMAKGRCKQVT